MHFGDNRSRTWSANSPSLWYEAPTASTSYFNGLDQEPTSSDHSNDVLYTIGKSDQVGRYMVASRDIQPGEVIFTDQPATIGPDNSSKPMCLGCYAKVDGRYKCPGCNWPMCKAACTKLPIHQAECTLFQIRQTKIDITNYDKRCAFYDAILPLRVLLLKYHNPKVYQLVRLLMDHKESIDDDTKAHRQKTVTFIRKYLKLGIDFTENEVHHVLGILSINSFVVHEGDESHMDLIALYPWTSLMSHNCISNTKIITREDFSYVCEATVFIPKGQEIVTNYHHYLYHYYGTNYRRKDLRHTWNFDCLCGRCKDRTEKGTYVSGVTCENCKYGTALPIDPIDYESVWICDHCQTKTPNEVVDEKLRKFESDIDHIADNTEESAIPREYEKLLRKMRYFLHENHYWILDVKRRLIDFYGHKKGFELERLSRDVLERKLEYCDHILEVVSKLCPGKSEIRGYLLWEKYGCIMRIAQWRWIRMKISSQQYLAILKTLKELLEEVILILGPIRANCDEGKIGVKAKDKLMEIDTLVKQFSRQSLLASTISLSDEKRFTGPRHHSNRRSICI